MSVVQRNGVKVVLRLPGMFWEPIEAHYAGADPQRWKKLACTHLYVHCHWTLDMIGAVFGHPKGHVSRLICQCVIELRMQFDFDANMGHDPEGILDAVDEELETAA